MEKTNWRSWQSTYQWNILYISIYSYTSKSCFVAVLYDVSANFTTFCIDQSFFSRENISTSRSQKGTYSMYRYIYIESKTIWKIENLHDLFLTTQCTKRRNSGTYIWGIIFHEVSCIKYCYRRIFLCWVELHN